MAKAIIHSTRQSVREFRVTPRKGHVSIEIKATELKRRDSEWRGKMFSTDHDEHEAGVKLRKVVIKDVIKLLKELYPNSKITFSQKAGCNCGCSPGFYVKTPAGNSMIPNGTTVFVEIVD